MLDEPRTGSPQAGPAGPSTVAADPGGPAPGRRGPGAAGLITGAADRAVVLGRGPVSTAPCSPNGVGMPRQPVSTRSDAQEAGVVALRAMPGRGSRCEPGRTRGREGASPTRLDLVQVGPSLGRFVHSRSGRQGCTPPPGSRRAAYLATEPRQVHPKAPPVAHAHLQHLPGAGRVTLFSLFSPPTRTQPAPSLR